MGNMSIIITRKLSCQNLSLLFTDGKTNISVSYLPLRASVLLSRRFKTDKRKLSLQIVGIELERNGHLPEKNDGIGCIMGFVVYCTLVLVRTLAAFIVIISLFLSLLFNSLEGSPA